MSGACPRTFPMKGHRGFNSNSNVFCECQLYDPLKGKCGVSASSKAPWGFFVLSFYTSGNELQDEQILFMFRV